MKIREGEPERFLDDFQSIVGSLGMNNLGCGPRSACYDAGYWTIRWVRGYEANVKAQARACVADRMIVLTLK
jgi:hypothetical protein